jgi:hypothetical protein
MLLHFIVSMASLLGFGRRCQLARIAAPLASSLDFLQGSFEKIHFQSFLGSSDKARQRWSHAQSSLIGKLD